MSYFPLFKYAKGGFSITDFCWQGGVQKDPKYADVILEQPLTYFLIQNMFSLYAMTVLYYKKQSRVVLPNALRSPSLISKDEPFTCVLHLHYWNILQFRRGNDQTNSYIKIRPGSPAGDITTMCHTKTLMAVL